MISLITFCLAIFILASIVQPWINNARIKVLIEELQRIKQIVEELGDRPSQKSVLPAQAKPLATIAQQEGTTPLAAAQQVRSTGQLEEQVTPSSKAPDPTTASPRDSRDTPSFERFFGAHLAVWVGGAALALAGIFLVKYSIDQGLLSPTVRVTLATVFGLLLLYCGESVRQRSSLANGTKIALSLAGAGIVVLYGAIFAASSLYDLLAPLPAFLGMALITALAVYLSLQHGPAIALLGLLGGFLAPTLTSSAQLSTPILFSYLFLIFLGLSTVSRQRNWSLLTNFSLICCFIWFIYSLNLVALPNDRVWLGLFLLAISVVTFLQSDLIAKKEAMATTSCPTRSGNSFYYFSLAGSLILMAILTAKADYSLTEWILFAVLAFGSLGLAYYNDKLYGLTPWLTMAVNLVLLLNWRPDNQLAWLVTLLFFASILALTGYYLMWRRSQPLKWATLTASSSTLHFLLAYSRGLPHAFATSTPLFWGVLALLIAAVAFYVIQQLYYQEGDTKIKQQLLAVYTSLATFFFTLALTIELKYEFLTVAIAAQIMVLAWINKRVSIAALRKIIALVVIAFVLLLTPQLLTLLQLVIYSLLETQLPFQRVIPIAQWPLFQLGLPAIMLLLAAQQLRQQETGPLISALELAALALLGLMGYYLIRHLFHPDSEVLFVKASLLERGVASNLLFIFGLLCLWIGRHYQRASFSLAGVLLCLGSLFRICYFDLLLYNPLYGKEAVLGIPVFNTLLLPFAAPLLWSTVARQEFDSLGHKHWSRVIATVQLILSFALVTLLVRHYFQGSYLSGRATNLEVYSYSLVWLLLGIALLASGIWQASKTLRNAALAIIVLTVGKVFLYDASELQGLYRVFSFLGLGLSLLGLSYVFSRYVLRQSNDRET